MSTPSQVTNTAIGAAGRNATHGGTDWRVFTLSAVPLLLFVILSLLDIDMMSASVNAAFAWSASTFGAYWQVLLLATFFTGLGIAASRSGAARLGNTRDTDFSTFQWMSVVMCTLLAGGGVFWGIAMGVVALILVTLGEGGVSALQSFIVVTAVPVSLILLPSVWTAPTLARQMALEQGIVKPDTATAPTPPE